MADQQPYDPDRCPPCRGKGVVLSNRGGTAHEVQCPWCGGAGRRQTGRNAQEFAPGAADGADAGAARAPDRA